ncbi:MAG: FIST N-terminal domain-containing protein [Candidatus Pacebacteria bacterium]|nr:FIST N-terminal domain-containing protein [Candidatus Paceibacterota bacterium]
MKNINVKTGYSKNRDPYKAVQELLGQIKQENISFVYFCSDKKYNQKKVNDAWRKGLPNTPFIGVTSGGWAPGLGNTTGLFTDQGIKDEGMTAMSIASEKIKIAIKPIYNMSADWKGKSEAALKEAASELNVDLKILDPNKYFGLFFHFMYPMNQNFAEEVLDSYYNLAPNLLICGMGVVEFNLLKLALVPGRIHYNGGMVEKDGAVVAIVNSETPFLMERASNYKIKKGPFICSKVEGKVIGELNGEPASLSYAKETGVPVNKQGTEKMLNLKLALKHPYGIKINDQIFIRGSFIPVGENKTKLLTMYKVAEGSELYIMERTGILEDTRKMTDRIKEKLGKVSAIIYFPCASRMKMMKDEEVSYPQMAEVLNIAPMIGIHGGPEYWAGILSAATITCLAFGE